MKENNTIFDRLRDRIDEAMTDDGTAPFFSFETVLLILSIIYGSVMRLRVWLYAIGLLPSRRLPCKVISIGNITAGGTGKTPMTIKLAQMLRQMGHRVAVVSRGYRGKLETDGGVVSDGLSILVGPEEAGDEPFLIASVLTGVPVVVGHDRYTAGMLAFKQFNPDVIILDDAFQHLKLKRDLNIVLLDSRSPKGNGYLLPRGVLREPLAALHRADAIVYTRCCPNTADSETIDLPTNRPTSRTDHVPVVRTVVGQLDGIQKERPDVGAFAGNKAVVFAGLAHNQQFFKVLEKADCRLVACFSFADHHVCSQTDIERIKDAAILEKADIVVTTMKDHVKMDSTIRWPVPLVVVDVHIQFLEHEQRFLDLLARLCPSRVEQP